MFGPSGQKNGHCTQIQSQYRAVILGTRCAAVTSKADGPIARARLLLLGLAFVPTAPKCTLIDGLVASVSWHFGSLAGKMGAA